MESASLLLPDVSPHLSGGACWAEITTQQSLRGKKQAGWIIADMKKDLPGTVPAILHFNIQAFPPFKHPGFFSQQSPHAPPRDLPLFTVESKVTCT